MEFKMLKSLVIPSYLKEEFYSEIAKENLQRVMMVSLFYLLFEIMFIFDVEMIYTSKDDIISISILIFHFAYIIISYILKYKVKKINGALVQVLIYIYCFVLIYWSIIISLDHIEQHRSITMYIVTLTAISAFCYRRALIMLITNIGLFGYFALEVYALIDFSSFHQGVIIDAKIYVADAFLMTAVSCVLAIIVYRLRLLVFLEKKELQDLAIKDSMTNLLNHKTICDYLEKVIEEADEEAKSVSILMTDIDHFKKINDTYGHQVGDQVITKIAAILTDIFQDEHYIGRYGGEEFLVILTDTDNKDAIELAEKFRREVEKNDFGLSQVTVSGGVRTFENESAEEMIMRADGALYQAKMGGRNCIINS